MTANKLIKKAQKLQQKGEYNPKEVLTYYYQAIDLCKTEDDDYNLLFSHYSIMHMCTHLEYNTGYKKKQRQDFHQQGEAAARKCMDILAPNGHLRTVWHFTEMGQFEEEVIRVAGNTLAWNQLQKAKTPENLETALGFAEMACSYVESPEYFYVIDTKVRILLALDRKETAYEVIRVTLIKDRDFGDFQEFKSDPDYLQWLRAKNEGLLANLKEEEKAFLRKMEGMIEQIRQQAEPATLPETPSKEISKQVMSYQEAIGKYGIVEFPYQRKDCSVVVLMGDVTVNGDLDSQWLKTQIKDLDKDSYMVLIDGNVTIEGNLIDDGLNFLFITGNLRCDYIFSADGYIDVLGKGDIKYGLAGEYNDGHIGIYGETQVPFVFNNDHDINIVASEETIVIDSFCNSRENVFFYPYVNPRERFGLENPQLLLAPAVWNEEDEFDHVKFVELLKKGESPFVKIKE
ncbi:hypothetical protein AAG747_27655 [Rapidithrix thailandica]|uniref:Uncharacterized protein n=1 Tax=Rapidithrix thailandica TaxID=413964 RepID=A0AAW9SD26_9BACT